MLIKLQDLKAQNDKLAKIEEEMRKEWKKDADKKKNKKNRNLSFQKYSEEGKVTIKLFNIDLFNTKSKKEIYDDYKLIY